MEGYSSVVELPYMKSMVQSQYTHTHTYTCLPKKNYYIKIHTILDRGFTTLTSPSYWGLHCNPGFTSNGLSGPPYRDYPTPVPPRLPLNTCLLLTVLIICGGRVHSAFIGVSVMTLNQHCMYPLGVNPIPLESHVQL